LNIITEFQVVKGKQGAKIYCHHCDHCHHCHFNIAVRSRISGAEPEIQSRNGIRNLFG